MGISGFFFPARNALLPNIVGSQDLGAANALSSATWSVMLAFGTALGGLVAGGLGVYKAFVLDALSFFLSAVLIARIQGGSKLDTVDESGSVTAAFRQYIDGLRYLRKHLHIFAIVLHKAALTLTTSGALQVIQVALAERVYVIGQGGGISMGIMFAAVGVGTGIGPIIARRYTNDRGSPLCIAIALSYLLISIGVATYLASQLH